jgi:hypothetical protein
VLLNIRVLFSPCGDSPESSNIAALEGKRDDIPEVKDTIAMARRFPDIVEMMPAKIHLLSGGGEEWFLQPGIVTAGKICCPT